MKKQLFLICSMMLFSLGFVYAQDHKGHSAEAEGPTKEQIFDAIKKGNARFVAGKPEAKKFDKARKETAKGQHPGTIVLTCADSRVAPEYIFDQTIGKVFVVRVAGNVVDPSLAGSIEYAAEHLKSKVIVVLGHESCGAVKAAIAGGEATPNIKDILTRIDPSVKKMKEQMKAATEAQLTSAVIEENVRAQMNSLLLSSPLIKAMVNAGEVVIYGGVYNIETGAVRWLN